MANERLGAVVGSLRRLAARSAAEAGDAHLLERFARQRDESAFAELVARHGRLVLGVCRRVLADHHAAEDAFQATFLVLARKARSLRRGGTLANWLFGVAYRVAKKARTTEARRRKRDRIAGTERLRDVPPPEASDWLPVLDAELNRLPAAYREAVVLCYLEGKSRAEAAKELGWPEGTVAGRLARARDLLRERLARRGVIAPAGLLAGSLAGELQAAVPAALASTTIQSAVGAAAWASAPVALAKGVLRTMWLTKAAKVSAPLLAVLLAFGGWQVASSPAAPTGESVPPQKPGAEAEMATLVPAPREEPPDVRNKEVFYLLNPASLQFDREEVNLVVPAVVVAELPVNKPLKPLANLTYEQNLLWHFTRGKLTLGVPREAKPVGIFLAGPRLNSGESWGPVELRRQGNLLTLTLESWTDNGPRKKNIVTRHAHLITLNPPGERLEAGKYTLKIVWREFEQDVENGATCSVLKAVRSVSLPFRVAKANEPTDDQEAAPSLSLEALENAKIAFVRPEGRCWQASTGRVVSLTGRSRVAARKPGLVVGSIAPVDVRLETLPGDEVPKLKPPALGAPLLAEVFGPELNSGEAMRVRSVEWQGRTATIRVEVWQDDGGRKDNVLSVPVALVPLRLPTKEAPKEGLTVRVEWVPLRAKWLGHPYAVQPPEKVGWLKDARERSEVRVK